jgi:hypothetical protein
MRLALVVIDDGRPEYLQPTMESLERHLPFSEIGIKILVNDSGDPAYADQLRIDYPQFTRQVHHTERRGLMGAFLSGWTTALEYQWDFLWHNEDDLVLLEAVDLQAMGWLLRKYPYLAQVMMLRQPITPKEQGAGGVILSELDDHTEHADGEFVWTEHDRWYGFNSHLTKRRVVELVVGGAKAFTGSNTGREERGVSDVLRPRGYRYAYWGAPGDAPRIDHIGTRHAEGYRV